MSTFALWICECARRVWLALGLRRADETADDDPDERRRRAVRLSAERRKCPSCGRAGALSEQEIDGPDGHATTVLRCRWCPYESGR